MTLKEQILYRSKAIIAGLGLSLLGFLGWFVENPQTAAAVQQVIPAPYAQFVPVVLAGIAATWFVHKVPNRTPTILTRTTDDDELVEEPTLDTVAVQGLTSGTDGTELGGGR